jgi:Prp8 binding protein
LSTGHEDIISSIALSPNGHSLLSNGMDNVLRCWDVRPFCPFADRCQKTFLGAQHNYEKGLIKCNW